MYFHLVFSVPHALVPLIWQNKKILFSLLFEATATTLQEVASDPKHLGAEIGFFGILHTWGQTLQPHPHIHCVVPGGGLSPDHTRWISSRSNFFLPVKVLSRVFRGKFCAGLRRAFRARRLVFFGECLPLADESHFSRFLRTLFQQDWVVYSKPPFGGPDHVLQYLARYTHRVANLEPPDCLRHRFRGSIPLEGLCESQQEAHHDSHRHRVPPPVPTACAAQGLSPHSILRMAGQQKARLTASTLPSSAGINAKADHGQFGSATCSKMSELPWSNAYR